MRVLLLLGLLGCPQPTAPAPAVDFPPQPQPPPVPVGAPASGQSPLDVAVQGPPLEGSVEHFDLVTLATTAVDYRIVVGLDALHSVDVALLYAHLAADPRWRVTREGGQVVAYQREEDAHGVWTVPRSGYHRDGQSVWRVAFAAGTAHASVWSRAPIVRHVAAGTPWSDVTGYALEGAGYKGLTATAMCVEGEGATLQVYEAAPPKSRPRSAAALAEAGEVIDGVMRGADAVRSGGFDPLGMPAGEPKNEQPQVSVAVREPGQLEVRGRANPGRPGWLWIRFVDTSGHPWQEATVGAASLERVGWSREPGQTLYFQSAVPVSPGPEFSASVEVWFEDEATRNVERLGAYPITLPAR